MVVRVANSLKSGSGVETSQGDASDRRDRHAARGIVIDPTTLVERGKQLPDTAGDMCRFSVQILRTLPRLRRHMPEVIHQAAVLLVGSAPVLWLMCVAMGYEGITVGTFITRSLGATAAVPLVAVLADVRTGAAMFFGFMLAAKVGCGLVAEIGSMRIEEEIDALEVMGVRPMAFVVAARVAAAWIAVPFLYFTGTGIAFYASRLGALHQFGDVSPGGYDQMFWSFQNVADLSYAFIKMMAIATCIVVVGCYYGYTARGGPVEVGWNTAKSMMVNVVLITVISAVLDQLFWGLRPNLPIVN